MDVRFFFSDILDILVTKHLHDKYVTLDGDVSWYLGSGRQTRRGTAGGQS